jgi:hypothetical protein
MMAELETTFRESSPEVQNLPRTQQAIAAQLDEKAQAMKSARKAWADAIAAQDAASSADLKQLQADAAALQESIAARRKLVMAQQKQELTEQQQAAIKGIKEALALAEAAEFDAQEAYTAARRALDDAQAKVRDAEASAAAARKITEQDEPALLVKLKAAEEQLKTAQAALAAAPMVHPPTITSVSVDASRRAYFTTTAVLSIGAFFALAIFLIPMRTAGAEAADPDHDMDDAALAV